MEGSSIKSAAKPQANAVVKQEQKPLTPAQRVKGMLDKRIGEIANALPKGWDEKRFVRIALTAVSANPKLAQACALSPTTFLGSMMTAAQLGLEPNTPMGKAYLLPYNNIDKNTGKKVPMVQFQIGVYGLVDLAFRSGLVKSISAEVRYQKDFWEYEKGINEKLRHIPYDEGDPGEAVGYYAVIHMKDTVNADGTKAEGAVHTCYMPKYRVMEHAKRFSKSYNRKTGTFSGPWATDFDSMAKKTVLIQALKYVPKATEDANLANAFNLDNTVRDGIGKDANTIRTEGIFAEGAASDSPLDDGEVIDATDAEVVDDASINESGEE
jgi:recombination protein RecT